MAPVKPACCESIIYFEELNVFLPQTRQANVVLICPKSTPSWSRVASSKGTHSQHTLLPSSEMDLVSTCLANIYSITCTLSSLITYSGLLDPFWRVGHFRLWRCRQTYAYDISTVISVCSVISVFFECSDNTSSSLRLYQNGEFTLVGPGYRGSTSRRSLAKQS